MLIKHEIAKAWESEMAFEEGHKGWMPLFFIIVLGK